MKLFLKLYLIPVLIFVAGCSNSSKMIKETPVYNGINLDTVKAQRFDTGKMWTFDNPPVDYFAKTYGFVPSQEWFDNARKAALKFANYCSASFVSADGLIMTNDHCGRSSVTEVTKEGEDLQKTGFFAETLQDERKVEGLYVEQLLFIKDVTKEVQDAINSGSTDLEKVNKKEAKFEELKNKYKEETGLKISIVTLYNGGQYSVYGYKRYNDIRLVFAPETQMGFFGGDYDNFTYPRYNMDVTFFRVYDDNGKPLKTENFFKWSSNGAKDGEPVFVVGNPGRTNRLNTVAQLEYYRDFQYPSTLSLLNELIDVYETEIKADPENSQKLQDKLYGYTNSYKVYKGMVEGLQDPVLMARKRDFENQFKSAVQSDSKLNSEYGDTWTNIEALRTELKNYSAKINAYGTSPLLVSDYFKIAKDIINYAEEMQLPKEQRMPQYDNIDSVKKSIFPEDFEKRRTDKYLRAQINYMISRVGLEDKNVNEFTDGKSGDEAVNSVLNRSKITTREKVEELLKNSPLDILNSDDPFITFVINTREILSDLQKRSKEITTQEEVLNQQLGRALFEVYGNSIPPDATFTLRISDGIIKGYPYNGTIAPSKVTFYGLYDRYYSFNGEYPWNLPERWKNPPAEFDLNVPFNFISTNDIIGGNSGSPVVNKNLEVVGLAFDGNIESLPGSFIFTTESNRCLSVASEGMMEAINDLYNADRLGEELRNSKLPDGSITSEESKTSQ